MKSFKLYIVALMALLVCTGFAQAQNSSIGQIKAFIVSGDVQVQGSDGKSAPLSRGDLVAVGSTVLTGNDGMVLLVFSNGAAMQIKPSSKVQVIKYDQTAFDDQGGANSFLRLNADPSKSTTELNITKGTLAGQVKKLNLDAGSQFTVDTPAGSAGIRGTIPTVTVNTDSNGVVTSVTVDCAEGDVTFTPTTVKGVPAALQTGTINLKAGGQVNISVTTDGNGVPTSVSVTGTGYDQAAAQAVVNSLYESLNDALIANGLPPVPVPVVPAPTPPTGGGTTTTPKPPPTPNTNPTISGT